MDSIVVINSRCVYCRQKEQLVKKDNLLFINMLRYEIYQIYNVFVLMSMTMSLLAQENAQAVAQGENKIDEK